MQPLTISSLCFCFNELSASRWNIHGNLLIGHSEIKHFYNILNPTLLRVLKLEQDNLDTTEMIELTGKIGFLVTVVIFVKKCF